MKRFVHLWLSAQCKCIPGVRKAVVLLGHDGKGPYRLGASWPEGSGNAPSLFSIANTALSQKKSVILARKKMIKATGAPLDEIACPLILDGVLLGVVAVEVASRQDVQQQEVVRSMMEGVNWLDAMALQQESGGRKQVLTVVELIAHCLKFSDFQQAATEVATDLATRFSCEHVYIGFLRGQDVKIAAISNCGQINYRSALLVDTADALQEAIDQGEVIRYPTSSGTENLEITRAHTQLVTEHGGGPVCSVPFAVNGTIVGGFLFEQQRDHPFTEQDAEYCKQVVALVGPVLELRRKEGYSLVKKVSDSAKKTKNRFLKTGSFALNSILVVCLLVVIGVPLIRVDYRVVAEASLEPIMQRAIVASQEGYIAESFVRAGDIVAAGDILATLDDTDLNLEKQKYLSQREQLQKQCDSALARHDRAQNSIIKAQVAQAVARLNLVEEQLARTRLKAPFDGLVVKGDLSQALGSPVERGQVLFEVAPNDAYHVILKVDERDIREVRLGQGGRLILSGVVGESLTFSVEKITPVSTVEEGRNFFRVEAELQEENAVLRPGMEGLAKISVNKRSLFWIWTHRMSEWLYLHIWSVLP